MLRWTRAVFCFAQDVEFLKKWRKIGLEDQVKSALDFI